MYDVLENAGQLALLLKSSNFWKFDKVQNDNQNLTKQKNKFTFEMIVRHRCMLTHMHLINKSNENKNTWKWVVTWLLNSILQSNGNHISSGNLSLCIRKHTDGTKMPV